MLSKRETDTNYSNPGCSTSMVSTMSGFVAATSSSTPTFAAALVLRISINLRFAVDSLFSTQPSTFHIWSFWIQFPAKSKQFCVNFCDWPHPRAAYQNKCRKLNRKGREFGPKRRENAAKVHGHGGWPRYAMLWLLWLLCYACKPSQPVPEGPQNMSGSPFGDLEYDKTSENTIYVIYIYILLYNNIYIYV